MTAAYSAGSSVAIAGAGIIGLSIAWRLAQRGCRVTVFDAATAAGEASWAGAGMLAPGGEVDRDSSLARSAIEARRLYPEFVAELAETSQLPIDFQQNGGLDLAYSASELAALEERCAIQRALGIASKRVEAKPLIDFWPRVRREGLCGGVFYPHDATVDPRDVTRALLKVCRALGVAIHESAEVQRMTLRESTVDVITSGVTESCDFAIVAAGAWSNHIDVHPLPKLPEVEPVKGVLLGYQQPDQTCSTIVRHGHTYLLQRASGLLIAGASVERIGFKREIEEQVVRDLAAQAGAVFPHLNETTPTTVWTGFRPHAAEMLIGPWHSPHLLLAYGHYRNGILLAPLTARTIAEQIHSAPVRK